MTIIDYNSNTERIITQIEASLISKLEYEQLKNISRHFNNYINKEFINYIKDYDFINYHLEVFLIKAGINHTISNIHKQIIIGNILLPNDFEIAEKLTKNGFTLEHLKVIIRFRSLLKNVILNEVNPDKELERQFKIYKKYVLKIIEIFQLEFEINNPTIILNRISEMLLTCPNFFETKSDYLKRKK